MWQVGKFSFVDNTAMLVVKLSILLSDFGKVLERKTLKISKMMK